MGHRIRQRMDELGIGQVDLLARIPDLSPQTLSALIARDSNRSQWSGRIADALGCSHRWLQTGEGPVSAGPAGVEVSAWSPTGRVPLVSWEAVAMTDRAEFARQLKTAPEWAAIDSHPPKGAFAVRLDSDAMTSPGGQAPSFPRGTVMIVDPARKPVPGDFVIARDPQTGRPTCKRLASDAGRLLLVALNPAYPSVSIESIDQCVIGTCCGWQSSGTL